MGDTAGGVLRRGSDRVIAGVCSGLGDYFHVEHTLVRVVFVILALLPPGVGILLYLVLWVLMDAGTGPAASHTLGDRYRQMRDELRREFRGLFGSPSNAASTTPPPTPGSGAPNPPPGNPWTGRSYRGRPGGFWFGVILIALGAYLLLANLGFLSRFRWDLFWPVVLIAVGLLFLLRRFR